ncbi:MAG TPA: hypothetical protein VF041_00300 [Gemmatimonadaceae bacterium]
MIDPFAFVDEGRTFTCAIEEARAPRTDAWWWFRVSTDDRNRYAPFRADASDTVSSVRERIVAYYDALLARRAAPATTYWNRGRPAARRESGTA